MVKKVWDDPNYLAKKARQAERRAIRRGQTPYDQPTYGYGQLPAGRGGRQLQALPPAGYQQGYHPSHYQAPNPMLQQPTAQLPVLGMQNGVVRPPALHAAPHAGHPVGQPAGGLVPLDPYGLKTPYQGPEGLAEHVVAGAAWTGRKAWQHRWNLTPAAGALGIAAGAAIDPATAIMATAATGGLAGLAQWKGPQQIAGRTWLSRLERGLVWKWAAGAGLWTTGVAAGGWEPFSLAGAAILGIATGAQSWAWWQSRRIRPPKTETEPDIDETQLSEDTMNLFAAWPETIGKTGPEATSPRPLQGSYIVLETLTEMLTEGEKVPTTISFIVELAEGVHSEDAVSRDIRKYLERVLRMGVGTVELEVNRDDAAQIRVTLTPGRHLEKADAIWNGPILLEDGSIPLAVTSDNRDVHAGLENASGVEHGAIFGTTDVGKSFTLTNMVMPGVMAKREVVIYVDGGLGSSAAHLAGACDWYAVEGPEEWGKAILVAHSVMRSRKTRRAQRGISKWRGPKEDIPIVTLVIDEATTVKDEIGHLEDKVREILREGRKHGVRVIQIAQDPMGDDLMGGRKARGLMAGGGTMIGHRVGDGVAQTLAGSGSSQKVDLLSLPPGPGWCAVIRKGQVLAQRARVRYAKEEKVLEHLEGFEPLALTGEDLIAAGGNYVARRRGIHAAAEMRGETVPELEHAQTSTDLDLVDLVDATDAQTSRQEPLPGSSEAAVTSLQSAQAKLSEQAQKWADTGDRNRGQILAILLANPAGLTKEGVIHQLPETQQLSDRTVRRALQKLEETGRATKTPAGLWQATETEAA